MCKGVTIVKQEICNKGGYMPTSQNKQENGIYYLVKEDKELVHKRCNCYTTHGSLALVIG